MRRILYWLGLVDVVWAVSPRGVFYLRAIRWRHEPKGDTRPYVRYLGERTFLKPKGRTGYPDCSGYVKRCCRYEDGPRWQRRWFGNKRLFGTLYKAGSLTTWEQGGAKLACTECTGGVQHLQVGEPYQHTDTRCIGPVRPIPENSLPGQLLRETGHTRT